MQPDPRELRELPLFAALKDDDLGELSRSMETRAVDEGERITPQGASGYSFFVIQEGTAQVIRDGLAVRTLGPGDFFGEIAIMDGGRRTADVVATSDMKLVVMFGTAFREMEARMPDVAEQLRAAVRERLGDS
ncbi:MAG: cyclic nucleotide-binding domain-containing protein [Actinomycetota bacterium]